VNNSLNQPDVGYIIPMFIQSLGLFVLYCLIKWTFHFCYALFIRPTSLTLLSSGNYIRLIIWCNIYILFIIFNHVSCCLWLRTKEIHGDPENVGRYVDIELSVNRGCGSNIICRVVCHIEVYSD